MKAVMDAAREILQLQLPIFEYRISVGAILTFYVLLASAGSIVRGIYGTKTGGD
jgi:hypothetical protein